MKDGPPPPNPLCLAKRPFMLLEYEPRTSHLSQCPLHQAIHSIVVDIKLQANGPFHSNKPLSKLNTPKTLNTLKAIKSSPGLALLAPGEKGE